MRMRVTLNGINRRGLANWRGREHWLGRKVRIWSAEHQAWWRANRCGYTVHPEAAGTYSFAEAWEATRHCGPEKRIIYEALPLSHIPEGTDLAELRREVERM